MTSFSSTLCVGILTVSDRAYKGVYEDLSGPAIEQWLQRAISSKWSAMSCIVPDERDQIERALMDLCDVHGCDLVLTTGGTGPAPRDVTPEATLAVGHKELPGFGERMRQISLQYVPTAILSRQTAVIRDHALIINLPGKPKSIQEILDDLFESIPYCIELMGGPIIETDPLVVTAFRPKSAPALSGSQIQEDS